MNDDNENFISKFYNKININNNNVLENIGNDFKHKKSLNFNIILLLFNNVSLYFFNYFIL